MNKKNPSKKWIGVTTTLILLLSCGYYWYSKNKSKNLSIGYGQAIQQDLIQRVTFAGVVMPARKTVITAPYNGYVRKLFVKVGDQVKTGDPIVSISQSLQSAENNFPLRSPFDGVVVQVPKSEGEYVHENDLKDFIVRIDDLHHLKIFSNAPEIDRNKIKINQEAIIKATAILNRSYKGIIKTLSLSAREKDEWSRSQTSEFPIAIDVIDADSNLRPGMSVLIDIITQKKENVLTLRHEYIHKDNETYYVMTQKGDKKTIKVGVQNDEAFEVTEGITADEILKQVDFAEIGQSEANSQR